MKELFQIFDSIEPLHPELRLYLLNKLRRIEVKRKFTFLSEGQIANQIYFIEQGLIRCYRYWEDKETTIWIMREGDLVVSVGSFFSQTPAIDNLEAMENTVVHSITYDELQYAYKHFPQFNLHRGVILEKYYNESVIRENLRHLPAHEAFRYLMEHQQYLFGRVSDKYLASYLGISLATLSYEKKRYLKSSTNQM